jgi:PAS domain S-box-containing protein
MIAADDTGQIVAVSDQALELLGYDHHGQLVGERLVGIIPRRFRQAHLAGFTMHLLTGRGPLISTPVLVPVRQRGGGEATVSLNIEAHRLPHGRTVFVATLGEPQQ